MMRPGWLAAHSARRVLLQARGETALEQVRRLDEVVVDRDERAPARASFRLGEEGDPLGPGGDEEAGAPLQVVEPDRHRANATARPTAGTPGRAARGGSRPPGSR